MIVKVVFSVLCVLIICNAQQLTELFSHMGCDYEKPCVFAYNLVLPMDGCKWPYESVPVNFAPCPETCTPMRTSSAIVFCKGKISKCDHVNHETPCKKAWCICSYQFSAWMLQLSDSKCPGQGKKKFFFDVNFHNAPYEFGCKENDPYNPCACNVQVLMNSDHCYLDIFTCVPKDNGTTVPTATTVPTTMPTSTTTENTTMETSPTTMPTLTTTVPTMPTSTTTVPTTMETSPKTVPTSTTTEPPTVQTSPTAETTQPITTPTSAPTSPTTMKTSPTSVTSSPNTTTTTTESQCLGQLDINFIMDTSGSINSTEFIKEKEFIKAVMAGMNVGREAFHVSLTNYATFAKIEFCLLEKFTVEEIQAAVDDVIPIGSGTRTDKALLKAAECSREYGRERVKQVIVLLSDGASDFRARTKFQADALKAEGFFIVAVGVQGSSAPVRFRKELDDIASPPASRNSILVYGFEDLLDITNDLLAAVCKK